MNPELAPIILVGLLGYVACAVACAIMPWFGFLLLVTIPLVKVLLRHVAGGLLVGYTYDLAVVFLAIIGAIMHRMRNPQKQPVRLPGHLVLCWFVLCLLLWGRTLIGAPEFGWALKKSLIFSIFNTMAIATLPLFMLSATEGRTLLRLLVFAGVVSSLAVPVFGRGIADWEGSRVSLGGASPLAVADLGANAIIVLISWLIERPGTKNLVLAGVCIPICALAIILTGTRGPILGIPLLLPILFWLYRRRVNFQTAIGSMFGLGFIVVVTAIIIDPSRLARFSGEELGSSVGNRVVRVQKTVSGFVRSPVIGHGTGSTSMLVNEGVKGIEGHPHNHLLEVAYELGLVGLVCWGTLIVAGLRAGWTLSRGEWENTDAKFVAVPMYMGFLYHVLMSFKMGTFTASYMMYFYLMATILLAEQRKRDYALWQQQMQQWHYLQQQQANLQVPGGEVAAAQALQSPR